MGIIHVLGAIIRFCFGKELYPDYKKKLGTYLSMVGIYFLIMIAGTYIEFLNAYMSNHLGVLYVFFVPWFIAGYYWAIIYGGTEETSPS